MVNRSWAAARAVILARSVYCCQSVRRSEARRLLFRRPTVYRPALMKPALTAIPSPVGWPVAVPGRMLFAPMRTSYLLHVATALVCAASAVRAQSQPTLIINASVIDGTGAPARPADVRTLNGRIDAIGHWTRNPGDRVVDAHGLTLAPGFIDTHSHHDWELFKLRDARAAVSQGMTT